MSADRDDRLTSARAAADAVLVYSRVKDEGPLWDVPAQREASPVRVFTALRQQYGRLDERIVGEILAQGNDRQERAS
jgi:hypothetical protein